MLNTIAVVLMFLWVLSVATENTLGGFTHIFLVIAAMALVVRAIHGNRGSHAAGDGK